MTRCAIVPAYGAPGPDEPLYSLTQGSFKSILPIAGKPMVQWVLDALNDAQQVDHIFLLGLPREIELVSRKPMTVINSHGELIDNLRQGLMEAARAFPDSGLVLSVSADLPAVTGPMIDWLIDYSAGKDYELYYSVIQREVIEKAFPGSKRTFTHFKDVDVCGGDVSLLHPNLIRSDNPLWSRLTEARKSPFKQAGMIGYGTLLKLALGQMTLPEAEQAVCSRLGIRGKVVLNPFAEAGMDVDKPHQHAMVEEFLKRREQSAG